MRVLSIVFGILAVCCAVAAACVSVYSYNVLLWGVKYAGYSAPHTAAFASAVPFAAGIAVCVILAVFFNKKAKVKAPDGASVK